MPGARFDTVIVGAGLVGSALAQLLSNEGFNVALVEKGPMVSAWDEQEHDLRVSAISLGSERVLTASGIWEDVRCRRVSPYERMFVWDAGSDGKIEFDCADLAVSHLGSIVENNLMLFCLHQKLRATPNVEVFPQADLEHIEYEQDVVCLGLKGADRLRCRLLVGADGARSSVRTMLGMESRVQSFDQSAIVAEVSTELHHRNTAWQRFLPTGPVALLPLSNGNCSIVWSCDQALADELLTLDDAAFAGRLTDASGAKLGTVGDIGPRRSFPLSSAHVAGYVAERSVIVGDAAHVVHPLAGQGVNLGLADVAALIQVLTAARTGKKDIGGQRTLRSYERWRKGENFLMVNAMVGLKKLFGSDSKTLSRVRGIGLDLVDAAAPVKHSLAARAMGLQGDLAQLMSGR